MNRRPSELALALSLFLSPTLAAQSIASAPDLASRIEAIRSETGVPALGGALFTLEGETETWVAGTRRANGSERVTKDDLWHLGSCTKSMTATLLALLVARGDLSWDAPLGEIFADRLDDMDLDYGDVTLVQLLGHRAGLAANPELRHFFDLRTTKDPIVAQRARLVEAVLASPPVHPPGGAFLYSNSGFILAGHLAERATGKSWEELIQTLLFDPLETKSAGFGPPGVGDEGVTQPWGHGMDGAPIEPGPLADNPAALGPAGTVHMSLADWAKYGRLHLAGARGDVKVGELTLTRAEFARLHSPLEGPGLAYGYGWGILERPWAGGDGKVLTHSGSNTMWRCEIWLGLANGVGILAVTNQAGSGADRATNEVAALLAEEIQRRAAAAAAR